MIKNAGEKLAKLKCALLEWYTIVPEMREEYSKNKNNASCYNKNDMDRVDKLFGEIADLQKQLELTKSDKFRILMELI